MRYRSQITTLTFLFFLVFANAYGEGRAQRTARADSSPPRSMYRLNFTLHVIEGGQDIVRQYALVLEERAEGKLRALTRIPVRQAPDQIMYVETGMKCDAQYQEVEGRIQLEVETHFSDVASTPSTSAEAPEIQEWQSRVGLSVVPNEKTVLSTYEGGENSRGYSLEVLAEKLR